MPESRLNRLFTTCTKRGITQQNVFQSFITGAVTALAGVGTLLMLNSTGISLQQEILAIIALLVACVGISMAAVSYLLLLLLRLGKPRNLPGSQAPAEDDH